MNTVLVHMWGIMPEFLRMMMGTIPVKQHPVMSREKALVMGLAQTMSCTEVMEENWLNRVVNVLNESDDFSTKMKQQVVKLCYDKVEQVCDFKGLDIIKNRWATGMAVGCIQ